ncbi:Crp/Fnr family transcriptional regulator [Lentibacillus sp. N15]
MLRLETQDYDRLLAKTTKLHMKKGKVIYREGLLSEYLYFIQEGEVRIFKNLDQNRELTLYTREKNDCFGEDIFTGDRYFATAEAMQDSLLLFIEKAAIESILEANGRMSLHFAKWIAEMLEASKSETRDFLAFGSEGAVASMFVRYANTYGIVTRHGIRITRPIVISDLSKYIGISRETVSRIVNRWKSEGVIVNDNKFSFLVKNMSYFTSLLEYDPCALDDYVL